MYQPKTNIAFLILASFLFVNSYTCYTTGITCKPFTHCFFRIFVHSRKMFRISALTPGFPIWSIVRATKSIISATVLLPVLEECQKLHKCGARAFPQKHPSSLRKNGYFSSGIIRDRNFHPLLALTSFASPYGCIGKKA